MRIFVWYDIYGTRVGRRNKEQPSPPHAIDDFVGMDLITIGVLFLFCLQVLCEKRLAPCNAFSLGVHCRLTLAAAADSDWWATAAHAERALSCMQGLLAATGVGGGGGGWEHGGGGGDGCDGSGGSGSKSNGDVVGEPGCSAAMDGGDGDGDGDGDGGGAAGVGGGGDGRGGGGDGGYCCDIAVGGPKRGNKRGRSGGSKSRIIGSGGGGGGGRCGSTSVMGSERGQQVTSVS